MSDLAAKYPYLTRTGPLGMLKFRRAVPPRLRADVGKREFVRAFGTANLDDVIRDYHILAAEVEEELAVAEEQVDWRGDHAEVLADYTALDPPLRQPCLSLAVGSSSW